MLFRCIRFGDIAKLVSRRSRNKTHRIFTLLFPCLLMHTKMHAT